jgi:hypothetical protein
MMCLFKPSVFSSHDIPFSHNRQALSLLPSLLLFKVLFSAIPSALLVSRCPNTMPAMRFTTEQDAELIRLKERLSMAWAAVARAFNARFPAQARSQINLQVRYSRSLAPRHSGGPARVGALLLLTQQQQGPGMYRHRLHVNRLHNSNIPVTSRICNILCSLFLYNQSLFCLAVVVYAMYPNTMCV